MLSNILGRIAVLPTTAKVLLGVAALIALGLSVVLSPLMVVLAVIVLIVAMLAVFIQLLRRGSPRRWGIIAVVALVLVLVFSGISNAVYFRGGQERASSPEPSQETQTAQREETTNAEETTSQAEKAEKAAIRSDPNPNKDEDRRRYDAVATVTDVVDGDTIEVEPAIDGEEEVRLIGVDTPETRDPEEEIEPYGPEASKYTSAKLDGEKIELEFDVEKRDQYGRILAYVYPVGKDMFNEDLLELGYAQVYTVSPNDKYEDRFEEAQEEAMDDDIGIWGLSRSELCKLADRGNGIGEGTPQCESSQQPAPEPQPAPVPAPTGRDLDCADFDSEGEAQAVLEDDPSDPHRLDADDDGQACEEGVGGGTASPTATASPSPSPEPSGGLPPAPGGDYDCADLTYSQAQQVLHSDPSDPHQLDGDGDGESCE